MRKMQFRILALILLTVMLLSTAAYADSTTFTFTTPGEKAEKQEGSEIADKIESLMKTIKREYYKDVTDEALLNGALKGMFETLDKHSTFFTPEEFEEFNRDIDGEFSGVGMVIERMEDGRIKVVSPIEDTPAYRAGVQTGDIVLKADDTELTGLTIEKAAGHIRGESGTKVKLEIKREGIKEHLYFELVRELIKINPVKYEIKPDNIGYIRITQFNGNVYDNLMAAIEMFKDKQVQGAIIDLRGNPGGLLSEVVDICQELIPTGPIVHIQEKGKITKTYESTLDKAPFKLVVLVNGGSASASEILAGAVKDSKTGILVGEKTYGKGTVQSVIPVGKSTGGVKLTVANYLTPSQFSLDGVGLTPDIEVKNATANSDETYTPIKGDRSLKQRIIGLDVLGMQQRLEVLGYKVQKQDGIFGPLTQTAVLSFQKDSQLPEDAVMDASDLQVLQTKFDEKLSGTDLQLERAIEEIKKMLTE